MPIPRERLRLTDDELEELLTGERTLRAATVSERGEPHVVPLWFFWHAGSVWVTSLRKSRRARDLASGSPAALCVDTGQEYAELRGAVLYGRFEAADGHPDLPAARRGLGRKYWGIDDVPELRSHGWLKFTPERIVSWDFRKIPGGRDRRTGAIEDGSDG